MHLEKQSKDSVEALMCNSKNLKLIINILAETYGHPEQLLKSQIHQVRCLETIEESELIYFVSFANKVTNMNIFNEIVGGDHHLANSMLLSELVADLPVSKQLQWAGICLTLGKMPTVTDFSIWLVNLRKTLNMVSDLLPVSGDQTKKNCRMLSSCK